MSVVEVVYCGNGCTSGGNPRQTQPPSLLCDWCEDRLRRWLREIPARFLQLPTFIEHGSTPKDPDAHAAKRTEAPAPMRLEIIDLLDGRRGRKWLGVAVTDDRRGVLGSVHAIAREIRDEKRLHPEPHPTVGTECALIERWMLWLCEQPWVTEAYDELRVVHRDLGVAIGERAPKPVGLCAVDTEDGPCGGPLRPTALGGVRCSKCGDAWDIDELRRLGLLLTAQETA